VRAVWLQRNDGAHGVTRPASHIQIGILIQALRAYLKGRNAEKFMRGGGVESEPWPDESGIRRWLPFCLVTNFFVNLVFPLTGQPGRTMISYKSKRTL